MNKKLIVGLILLIAAVGAGWIWLKSPGRTMRPAPVEHVHGAVSETALATLFAQVVCPEPDCAAKGKTLAKDTCPTSVEVQSQIRNMMAQGLTAEGVMSHLRMMGMVPGDPGLPQGHPPINPQPKQEPKPSEGL